MSTASPRWKSTNGKFEDHDAESDVINEIAGTEQALSNDIVDKGHGDAPATQEAILRDISLDTANLTANDEDIWRKHEQAFQRKVQNQSLTPEAAEADLQDVGVPVRESAPSQPAAQPKRVAGQNTVRTHPVASDDVVKAKTLRNASSKKVRLMSPPMSTAAIAPDWRGTRSTRSKPRGPIKTGRKGI